MFNLYLVRCVPVNFAYADTKSFQIPLRQTHLPAKTTLTLCDTNSLLDP